MVSLARENLSVTQSALLGLREQQPRRTPFDPSMVVLKLSTTIPLLTAMGSLLYLLYHFVVPLNSCDLIMLVGNFASLDFWP